MKVSLYLAEVIGAGEQHAVLCEALIKALYKDGRVVVVTTRTKCSYILDVRHRDGIDLLSHSWDPNVNIRFIVDLITVGSIIVRRPHMRFSIKCIKC